jgi:hypothetical protein
MNRRRLLLFALLLVAAWLALFGDKTPPDSMNGEVVAPTLPRPERDSESRLAARRPADSRSALSSPRVGKADANLEIAALIPRAQLIPGIGDGRASRDLFPSLSWTPLPPPLPVRSTKPLAPMAPPLPFVYLGKKLEAGRWEAYLARGEQVFIVRQGARLEKDYRVKAITPSTMTLIYLPLQQSQTLSIGESP